MFLLMMFCVDVLIVDVDVLLLSIISSNSGDSTWLFSKGWFCPSASIAVEFAHAEINKHIYNKNIII